MSVTVAISLLLALIDHAQQISAIIQAAQANGQTDLSPEQWAAIADSDDKARAGLVAALAVLQTTPLPKVAPEALGT